VSKARSGVVLNQRPVTIEFDGRTVSGAYRVWAGLVTVYSASGRKITQVGGAPPAILARLMPRELVQEGDV
jgi:hypothetical protein